MISFHKCICILLFIFKDESDLPHDKFGEFKSCSMEKFEVKSSESPTYFMGLNYRGFFLLFMAALFKRFSGFLSEFYDFLASNIKLFCWTGLKIKIKSVSVIKFYRLALTKQPTNHLLKYIFRS